jgi:DNA-binding NarL/FixJ family response regulator
MMVKEHKTLSAQSVTVLKLIAEGRSYEQILTLQPDLTYRDIFDAAREALEATGEVLSDYQERMAEIRRDHPRAYEPWTHEEDATLVRLAQVGRTVDEIAAQLQRQPSAIRGRMQKRNLI